MPDGQACYVDGVVWYNYYHRSRIRYLSKKKFANFNEFPEIKKFVKIRTKIR